MARNLQVGDRIRAKVRSMGGWKGEGIVTAPDYGTDRHRPIEFHKIGQDPDDPPCLFCRCEVTLVRRASTHDL
ncbi:MAG: hypothetical protein RLZZ32_985 [Cyanobacteriota bacterium]|jgi:hypothetical protein